MIGRLNVGKSKNWFGLRGVAHFVENKLKVLFFCEEGKIFHRVECSTCFMLLLSHLLRYLLIFFAIKGMVFAIDNRFEDSFPIPLPDVSLILLLHADVQELVHLELPLHLQQKVENISVNIIQLQQQVSR